MYPRYIIFSLSPRHLLIPPSFLETLYLFIELVVCDIMMLVMR